MGTRSRRRALRIRRRIGRLLSRLVLLGAITAAAKYFSDFKLGEARRQRIKGLLGKG
jgi:hypothetical protein